MKNNLHCLGMKLGYLCICSCMKVACLGKSLGYRMASLYRYLVFSLNPFWFQFCYFTCISIMGFLVLSVSKSSRPTDLNILFTSVSASTVSSMSAVEIEVFSNAQLVVLTILMFLGGEVFISFLELQFEKSRLIIKKNKQEQKNNVVVDHDDQIELGKLSSYGSYHDSNKGIINDFSVGNEIKSLGSGSSDHDLQYNSVKYLSYVVLVYLFVVLGGGSTLVLIYMRFVPSASEILNSKGLNIVTFSLFTTVSSFVNCGFIPTNENMVVFRKNSGLLLLIIPQMLVGNTLFPACLRFVLGFLGRFSKRDELNYMLKMNRNNNTKDENQIGYPANEFLISTKQSLLLVATVLGFLLVQFILFCSMEWNSEGLDGMNSFQKLVGALFQIVNTRHSGENIIDLSTISPAILVLFIVMMYLPPYTSFVPLINTDEQLVGNCDQRRKRRRRQIDNLLFSQLSYLAIFIILICITERKKLKDDPLNFNVLNITIEVVSAYGNVGYTAGYSCKRQLHPDGHCKDMMYGFVGRWSNKGKLILILLMFFGRLKKFNLKGGRAWKLSPN